MSHDRSRVAKAGAAVLDQGLSSVASFAASVAVATQLSVEAHGRFAFALAAMGLLVGAHQAVIIEPALMHAQGRFREAPEAHQAVVWRLHTGLSLAVALLMAVIGGVGYAVGGETAKGALPLAALAVVAPAWLTLNLARRIEFAALRPARAAQRAGLFAVFVGVGIAGLIVTKRLGPVTTLLVLGASAALVLVLDARRIWVKSDGAALREEVVRSHRDHAGWALGATVARWAPLHGTAFLLPIVAVDGFFHAGTLRTHLLLALPMLQAMSALGTLSTSVYARRRAQGEPVGLGKAIAGWTSLSAGYAIALVLLGEQVLTRLSPTPTHASWRIAVAVVVVVQAPAAMLGGWLLAHAQSRRIFVATASASVVSLAVALYLLRTNPADGSFISMAVAYTAGMLSLGVAALRTPRCAALDSQRE